MNKKPKIIRACTVSMSIDLMEGVLPELKPKYDVMLLTSPGKELEDAVRKHGVRGIAVPMERHISLVRDLKALVALIKVLRRERPQMIHSMTPKAGLLCVVAAWLARVPVRIHTFTGLVWPTEKGMKRKILMATDWLTCACATHVIPEGQGVLDDLKSVTRKPMKVLGYGNVKGIDLEQYSIENLKLRIENYPTDKKERLKSIAHKDSGLFTFLFVGRIVGDKGINELVAAFRKLNEEYKDARLILIGRYEDELNPVSERTRELIEKNPAVEWVGPKYGDELLAYYASADCFVMPSYREGFPNTVIEAGAMGLPCIVTDINGSREIISLSHPYPKGEVERLSARDNGIVVPSKDEQSLYEAMALMMKNTEMRQRMAGNARRMIADRYDQHYVRQCLLKFYDEIMKD